MTHCETLHSELPPWSREPSVTHRRQCPGEECYLTGMGREGDLKTTLRLYWSISNNTTKTTKDLNSFEFRLLRLQKRSTKIRNSGWGRLQSRLSLDVPTGSQVD